MNLISPPVSDFLNPPTAKVHIDGWAHVFQVNASGRCADIMKSHVSSVQILSTDEETLAAISTNAAATSPALGQRAFGGAIWTLAQTAGSKGAAIASQLVLAAILSKESFGKFAEVILIVTLASLGQQLGVGEILVRRHRNFQKWAEIAFWINLTAGIFGAAIVVVIAPFADIFFKDAHGLAPLLLVAAVGLPFEAMTVVPQAQLRKDLQFRRLAILGTANVVGASLLSVTFAATKFVWPDSPLAGPMSLVLPRPLMATIVLAASFKISTFRLRMRPAPRRWWYVLRDSQYFLFTSFFSTLLMQGDYMLVGIFFSTEQLGAYYFAYNISTQTSQLVSANFATVLLPSFAKLDREPERQNAAYLRVCATIALVGVIGCVSQAILGGPLLHWVYGNKWNDAILLFQLLTIGMIFTLPTVASSSLLQAQGRYRRSMIWTVLMAVCFLSGVAIGASTGSTKGVAAAEMIFYAIFGPLNVLLPLGFTLKKWSKLVKAVFVFPILSAGAATVAAFCVYKLTGRVPELARAAVMVMVTIAVYAVAIYFWRAAEMRELLSGLRGKRLVRS